MPRDSIYRPLHPHPPRLFRLPRRLQRPKSGPTTDSLSIPMDIAEKLPSSSLEAALKSRDASAAILRVFTQPDYGKITDNP